jgi:hypothetical protein
MQSKAVKISLFGSGKFGFSNLKCDARSFRACSTGEHNRHRVDQIIGGSSSSMLRERAQKMCKRHFKVTAQKIHSPIKGLMTWQIRKPAKPVVLNKIVNLTVIELFIQLTKRINRDDPFVAKLSLEIIQALIVQRALLVVGLTDKQEESRHFQ